MRVRTTGDGAAHAYRGTEILKTVIKAVLGVALTLAASLVAAQTFPVKPIRIIIPYPPGGGTDVLARLVGRHLGEVAKQAVVIENRPGAGAQIGIDLVSKAPAALSPEQFLTFIRADNAKWAKLIRERGIVIEGAR